VQVCALTGCAAVLLNCQAKTVHSWAGIGLANGEADFIVKRVVSNKYKSAVWKKNDVLIIDEVSMMSQKIFEILDGIAKQVRKDMRPFGGLQVIFSGDFYQLPPVDDRQNEDPSASAFCFESPEWSNTFPVVVQLKKIFRQTDEVYTGILNQIRVGKLFKSALETLTPHIGKVLPETFVPTILLPRRRDAELINAAELEKLPGEKKVYTLTKAETLPEKAQAHVKFTPEQCEMEHTFLMNNIMADKEIVLKKGAQVMCIANIDMESAEPIVNGSQGIIIDFVGNLPLVQFNSGARRTVGYHTWNSETYPSLGVKQIPLIYAWAITIHKAQGVSLDMAQIDAGSNIFECGQTYVALSRIKSLQGLYLTAFNPQKIKVNKKVQEYYKTLV
jgi:ATP-dependent DNA helicase PIF1